MECTLKTCSSTTRNKHAYELKKKISKQLWRSRVFSQSRSKYGVRRGDLIPSEEPGLVLMAYTFARRQRGEIAEWSAYLPDNLKVKGSSPAPAMFFSPLFLGGLGHLSTPPNNTDERLLGGRVVSVATLPVMVSRLG